MSCEEFGLALIDDPAPRSQAVEAHIVSCPRCRELQSAHRAAQRLRHLPMELAMDASSIPVQSLWRRRLVLRGTLAGLGAAVAAALFLAVPSLPRSPIAGTRNTRVAPAKKDVRTAERDDSLQQLLLEVHSYTQHEVSPHDETLEAFGELPHLLTPTSNAVSTNAVPPLPRGHR